MPSLLDIAPPELVKRQVDIRGTKIDIESVRNKTWVQLYDRYPALVGIVQGQRGDTVTTVDIMEAQAALIAAGTGHPFEAEHIEAAFNLPAKDQEALVLQIVEISNPGEIFSPLRKSATHSSGDVSGAALEPGGKAPATS